MQDTQAPEKGSIVTFIGYEVDDPNLEPILEPGKRLVVTGVSDDGGGDLVFDVCPCDEDGKEIEGAQRDQVFISEIQLDQADPPAEETEETVNPARLFSGNARGENSPPVEEAVNPASLFSGDDGGENSPPAEKAVNPARLFSGYEAHDLADLYPLMPDRSDGFEALVASIREHGLQEPVVLFQGKLLDGRHRLRACLKAGVEPQITTFKGTEAEAEAFVVAKNAHRRSLTVSQRREIVKVAIGAGDTHARAAAKAGLTRSAVSKMLKADKDREERSKAREQGRQAKPLWSPKTQLLRLEECWARCETEVRTCFLDKARAQDKAPSRGFSGQNIRHMWLKAPEEARQDFLDWLAMEGDPRVLPRDDAAKE